MLEDWRVPGILAEIRRAACCGASYSKLRVLQDDLSVAN